MIRADAFVTPNPQVGTEQSWRTVAALAQYDLRHAEAAIAHGKALADFKAQYRAEFRKLGSPERLREYEDIRRQRLIASEEQRRQLHLDDEGVAAVTAARRQAKEESLALLKRAGIDPSHVAALQARYVDAEEEVFWNSYKDVYAKANVLDKRPKNTDFGPPYAGWYWRYSYSLEGDGAWLDRDPVRYLNSSVGQVGSDTGLTVSGTDDSDDLTIDYDTGLQIWYQPPTTGLLTVRINYVAALTQSSGSTDDEWGYSSVRVTHQPYFAGQVVSPIVGYKGLALIAQKKVTSIDYDWSVNWPYNAGATRTMTFVVPSTVVQQGQWHLVRVGLYARNKIHANDVSADSRLNQQYLIRQVGLTIT
jgi:hypothetical protein